ncbi:MAG: YrzI family small protein [Bacillus sp. (in: firmicutes)]
MTLNLIFFTVTFKMNKMTREQALQYEAIKKIHEENELKISQYRNFM